MKKMMKMLMGVSCALLAGTVVAADDPARGLDGSSVAQSCVVRIGTLEYTTAAWTSGDGSETNAIKGVGFVAQAEPVVFRDYDAQTGFFTIGVSATKGE